jgi:trimeric autotransporter adhesin
MFFYFPSSTLSSLLLTLALAAPCPAAAQVLSTVAGGGAPDGKSVLGNAAPVGTFAFDRNGTLYVGTDYRIAKVSADGTLATVMGNGASSWLVTDVLRSDMSLSADDFCLDFAGNLLIAESSNRRILRRSPDGNVQVIFSGAPGPGPRSLALASDGSLYFIDGIYVRKMSPSGTVTTISQSMVNGFGGDGGSAMQAVFSHDVRDLAVDGQGNVYLADTANHRIRKIDANGILSTVAGNGTAAFDGDGGPASAAALNLPTSVAVDAAGNLFIADTRNSRIRKVSSSGIISTIAGNGLVGFTGDGAPASNAALNNPQLLAMDPFSNLHFYDGANYRIRKISADGLIATIAGGSSPFPFGDGNAATNANLQNPKNFAFDGSGNMYVADAGNSRVRKIAPNGRISTIAGNGNNGFGGDGGLATQAMLSQPTAIAIDATGNLYVADYSNNRVRKVTPAGIISTVAGGGNPFPTLGDGGIATNAYLNSPYSLAFDANGNLLIGCSGSIRKLTPAGLISTIAGKPSGDYNFTGDGGPATEARITFVEGLAFDSQGSLYLADAMNARIRKITTDGIIQTVAGNGTFGVAVDGGLAVQSPVGRLSGNPVVDSAGNLYFSDPNDNRIRKVTPDGIISTLAGVSRKAGFGGDGSSGSNAALNYPTGIAIDAQGDIHFADSYNNRIRKISTRGGANYSDMWWAGSVENGWGMSVQQHASGVQFIALYIYDANGLPRWYAMPGGSWSNGFTTYSGQLFQPTSAPLNNYQAAAFSVGAPAGTATIRYIDNVVAELSYTIDGISGTKRLQRMAFGQGNATLDVGDMWWGGTNENGWGINIAQQGNTLFSIWYTYGNDGKAQWFTQPGGTWNGSVYSGPLATTSGSRWLGATYDPLLFRVNAVGTFSLRFSNTDNAILNYSFSSGPFAGVSQSKAIVRMAY